MNELKLHEMIKTKSEKESTKKRGENPHLTLDSLLQRVTHLWRGKANLYFRERSYNLCRHRKKRAEKIF